MYELKFLGRAIQDFKNIALPFQKIIKEKLIILAENPDILKNNIIKLTGTKENYYRLRIGNYRVIYEGVFQDKKETKFAITTIDDIYKYADVLIETAKIYSEVKEENKQGL